MGDTPRPGREDPAPLGEGIRIKLRMVEVKKEVGRPFSAEKCGVA